MRYVPHVGRGMVMGLADVVPGVSGGTLAMILGIYARFIAALAALDVRLLRAALGVGTASGRQRLRIEAERTDLAFLLAVGLGIGIALIGGAHVIGALLERFPVGMMALFFGLVLAGARVPWAQIGAKRPMLALPALVGVAIGALAGLLPAQDIATPWPVVAGAGMLAITAMLLPGISGSAVLVLIGVYPVVIEAVRAPHIGVLLAFGAGAAIGLMAASRLIRWVLASWADWTLASLAGLMIGSLVRVWPWRSAGGFGAGIPAMPGFDLVPMAAIIIGIGVALGLERLGSRAT